MILLIATGCLINRTWLIGRRFCSRRWSSPEGCSLLRCAYSSCSRRIRHRKGCAHFNRHSKEPRMQDFSGHKWTHRRYVRQKSVQQTEIMKIYTKITDQSSRNWSVRLLTNNVNHYIVYVMECILCLNVVFLRLMQELNVGWMQFERPIRQPNASNWVRTAQTGRFTERKR